MSQTYSICIWTGMQGWICHLWHVVIIVRHLTEYRENLPVYMWALYFHLHYYNLNYHNHRGRPDPVHVMEQMLIETYNIDKRVIIEGIAKLSDWFSKKLSFCYFSTWLWKRKKPRTREILQGLPRNHWWNQNRNLPATPPQQQLQRPQTIPLQKLRQNPPQQQKLQSLRQQTRARPHGWDGLPFLSCWRICSAQYWRGIPVLVGIATSREYEVKKEG